jgi:serine phosphatase RsbU (regulator of sigma subunit)
MLYHDNNQSIEAGELLETLNTTRKALTAKFTQLAFEAHDPQAAICSYVNAEISHGIL